MVKFLINRPAFAWVLVLLIALAKAISITQLPISQYPTIAPPLIIITATCSGANARTLDESVTSVIKQEVNGADGLLYMESISQGGNGQAQITVTFEAGVDLALTQVDVQNHLKRVETRLPSQVTQQDVQVDKAHSDFLLFATPASTDDRMDPVAPGDYISHNVLNEIKRVPGVGQTILLDTECAMHAWIDPAELVGYKLTPADVYNAIRAQNALVSADTIDDLPPISNQPLVATVVVESQLTTTEQFDNIVLVARPDGSLVRVKDVTRLELGGRTYSTSTRINGQPISVIGVQLSPTGNALDTVKAVKVKLEELSKYFPAGMEYKVPYDTSKFVRISIGEVVKTPFEAMALVFLVMLLFLQNIRYTLVPSIVVPISLLGASAAMNVIGFSINVLTMFGLILTIGILVDDTIVVVESAEQIMAKKGLPPCEATREAVGQIIGATIGTMLVLMAVFIPMAFFSGSIGAIYHQFSLSMVSSIFFSALMALTLTPALYSTLLKPVEKGSHREGKGLFDWLNRMFSTTTNRYQSFMERMLEKIFRYMVTHVALIVVVMFLLLRLPSSFLPAEDQGHIVTNIRLPPGTPANRTLKVIKQVENYCKQGRAVESIMAIRGFSLPGNGPNAGIVFAPFKGWSEHKGKDQTADTVIGWAFSALFSGIHGAIVFPLNPPPIPELDSATDFVFRLQDRADLDHDALMATRNQLPRMAAQNEVITGMRPKDLEGSSQYQVDIDRERANALSVSFTDISAVLSTVLGSAYANDFPNYDRQQRVIVQADKINRMQPEDIMNLYVRSAQGNMVPISTFAKDHRIVSPMQLACYNGYLTIHFLGAAAPGASSGDAMAEMERLAAEPPADIGYGWTGQSLQEEASGSQVPTLYALSLLAVFLVLAALYESWSIPAVMILMVSLSVLSALLGVTLRAMPDDVYFKVGLIAAVGLSTKDTVLIIGFVKDLQAQDRSLVDTTLGTVRLWFHPIIMTSFAFILGVLPLVIAIGASPASQRVIGIGVMGGMIITTVLAMALMPAFFVMVRRTFKDSERRRRLDATYRPLDEEV